MAGRVRMDDIEETAPFIQIGRISDFLLTGRKTVTIGDREIVVFKVDGIFYAVDSKCYHNGGPLNEGHIQDIENITCVVCPWHKYKISLSTGEGYYQAIDPKNSKQPPCWRSKGKKQRVHKIKVDNETVFVALTLGGEALESDYYYSEDFKKRMNVT